MEKVKLTREQARAVEHKKKNDGRGIKAVLNDIFYEPKFTDIRSVNEVIREIGMENFIKALYIGYEVEPEIKVGDFVDINLFGISRIAEVTGVKGNMIAINGSDEYHLFKINRVLTDEEKQEEKQRRWWESNNRAVWELKEGDILKDIYQRENHEVVGIGFMGSVMFEGDTSYRAVDEIENKCTVVCFAEDRKDVDHD